MKALIERQLNRYGIASLEFKTPVLLECPPCRDDFDVWQNITVSVIMHGLPQSFVIRAKMSTDLASVPRELWSFVPPHRRIKRPAVFHDGLYQDRHWIIMPETASRRITRGEADALLYVGCLSEGMDEDTCERVYLAVRVGGSHVWHAHDGAFIE